MSLALALPAAGARGPAARVAAVAVAAIFVTAVAALPLPAAWTAWLAPEAHRAAVDTAAALGAPTPRFVATSLDPGGTRERSLAALSVAAAFLAGSLVGASSRRRVFGWGALSVGAVIVVTLAHHALDARALYGLHVPVHTGARLSSPLLNPNHLGGFCAFGVVLATGLAAESERASVRIALGGLAVVAGGVVVFTASRGAAAALGLGLLALVALLVRAAWRERGLEGRRAQWTVLGLGAGAATAGAIVGLGALGERLVQGDYDKLAIQARASALLFERPLFGVGRGAFSVASLPSLPGALRYTHPESLPLQWGIEWGLPFAALALLVTVVALGRAAWSTRSPARAGAVVAVVALGLQNLVDFGLEMSGEAVVVAAVAGAALVERRRRGPVRAPRLRHLVIMTLASGALLLPAFGPSVARGGGLERGLAMERALADGRPRAATEGLEEALALHPLEPTLPLYAGAAGLQTDDPRTPALLNRAMRLAPSWAAPHLLAARYLVAGGALDQAVLEWRAAEERQAGDAVADACTFLPPDAPLALARTAAPRASETRFLGALAACLPLEAPLTAAIDAELASVEGHVGARAARRRAHRALRARDPEEALSVLEGLPATDVTAAMLRAQALSALGRAEEARATLARVPHGFETLASLARLARLEAAVGADEALEATLARHRAALVREGRGMGSALLLEAELLARRGDLGGAVATYLRADRVDPGLGALARAAALVARGGDARMRFQVDSALCRRHGEGDAACARLAAHRALSSVPTPPRAPE